MISSSKVSKTVESNVRQYEQKKTKDELALSNANSARVRLISTIASKMSEMAALHVKDDNAPLPDAIRTMLSSRENKLKALEQDLAQHEHSIGGSMKQLERQKKALSDLISGMNGQLSQDAEYVQLKQELDSLEKDDSTNGLIENQLASEFKEKLKAYQSDRLFNYLKEVDSDKKSKSGQFMFDLIAGWTDYRTNLENELLLTDALQAISEARTKRNLQIIDVRNKVTAKRNAVEVSSNLSKAKSDIQATEKAIEDGKKYASSCRTNIRLITENRDADYDRIVELITKSFSLKSIEELESIAAKTSTQQDDRIVAEIKKLREDLRNVENSIRPLREAFEASDAEYKKAKDFERRVDKLTSSDYEFKKSLEIDTLMTAYMLNELSLSQAESQVKSKRVEIEDTSSSYSSSSSSSSWSSSSSSSSSDWSSSSSSSSYSSSDSSGGGSYSTSDSF